MTWCGREASRLDGRIATLRANSYIVPAGCDEVKMSELKNRNNNLMKCLAGLAIDLGVGTASHLDVVWR